MNKTKEISKKICKLAGIEAKRQIEVNCCNECSDCQSGDCNTLYYPDFESPENFVKLLKVYLNTSNDYISFDTKETAAMFVASGHGLIDVKIPSHKEETITTGIP